MKAMFTGDDIAEMLLDSSGSPGPLHRQLSEGLRQLIELGELPPEALLPSERTLASAMHVSRTTAVAAYETLRQDGLVERRQGSGTRVRAARRNGNREIVSANALSGTHAADQFLSKSLATVDFSMAALPCLPAVPRLMANLSETDYAKLGAEQPGYHPRGLGILREQIARLYSSNGVRTSPDEILVTNGAQQALELITHGCLQPGDEIVTETPTYRGAVEAFRLVSSRLRSVACDEGGIDTAQLEQLAEQRPPRLVYVQSAVHNPTGTVMADSRKRHLGSISQRFNSIIVDDTALEGTLFAGVSKTPLAAVVRTDLLLTIGSMSKLFWGGLRVGWIRGDARVISRLAQMKGITDLGTSLVSQLVAVHLLEDLEEAKGVRRDQLSSGLEYLTALLTAQLPDWSWQTPRGGASLWVRVPTESVTSFAHVAMRSGVAILPGTLFSPDGGNDDFTRLPYSLPRSVTKTGVARLAEAWDAYRRGHGVVPVQSATT